jgi:hypothetical protein
VNINKNRTQHSTYITTNLATQKLTTGISISTQCVPLKSCGIEEALLLEVCLVQELLNRLFVIARVGVYTSLLLILKDAERPVKTYQPDAKAVADNHRHNPPCIRRSLVCTERLWTYQISNCVSNI